MPHDVDETTEPTTEPTFAMHRRHRPPWWPWWWPWPPPWPFEPPVPPRVADRPTILAVTYLGPVLHLSPNVFNPTGKPLNLMLLYSVEASAADPSVTKRTLTVTITPSGSTTPDAPTSGPLAAGVSLNVGDSASLTLVDTDPTGDSLPSLPFTFVGAAPAPPGTIPATPSILGVTYVSGS